jgi:hypothetical protein
LCTLLTSFQEGLRGYILFVSIGNVCKDRHGLYSSGLGLKAHLQIHI